MLNAERECPFSEAGRVKLMLGHANQNLGKQAVIKTISPVVAILCFNVLSFELQ